MATTSNNQISQDKTGNLKNVADLLNKAAPAIHAGGDAILKVTEKMNLDMEQFMEKYHTEYGELRLKVLEDSFAKGEITREEYMNKLKSIQETELSEKAQLMDKYAEAARAQGRKVRDTGLGIGAAAVGGGALLFGAGKLAKTIHDIRKNQ